MLIELTIRETGRRVAIAVEHVVSIESWRREGAAVQTTHGYYPVTEDYSDVLILMSGAEPTIEADGIRWLPDDQEDRDKEGDY